LHEWPTTADVVAGNPPPCFRPNQPRLLGMYLPRLRSPLMNMRWLKREARSASRTTSRGRLGSGSNRQVSYFVHVLHYIDGIDAKCRCKQASKHHQAIMAMNRHRQGDCTYVVCYGQTLADADTLKSASVTYFVHTPRGEAVSPRGQREWFMLGD
jgi:hypothetical protein